MNIEGLEITVVRKRIKNLYLRVLPPDGSISISAPRNVSDKAIQQFVQRKLPWIREKQQQIRTRKRSKPYQLVAGETHYILGQAYRLVIVEKGSRYRIDLRSDEIVFQVRA
ncbi:MAG TPA: M48 family metallopeptidase, partial [Clostridiaceae bacterium]|nr:M48 family metallopeptidase [Clostridiaceae bacterium]